MTEPLLEALRAMPGSAAALKVVVGAASPDALVESAARHGLGAVLAHELTAAGVALPTPASRALRTHATSIIGTSLHVKALLTRTLDALNGRGVVPVLLKGYGLSARYYPEPLLRPMGDVDVLVPRARLADAEAALEGLALKRSEAPAEEYAREHHHHLVFASDTASVELHFRALTGFGSAIEGDPLYERAREATLEGRPVRYLRPEDELVYLATHASQHLLSRLSWLYDLKLLMRAERLDWGGVVTLSRQSGMQTPVYLALWAARESLGAPVPDDVLAALRPPVWQAGLLHRLFSGPRLVAVPLAEKKWRTYAVMPLVSTGLPRMGSFTLHHLGRGLRRKWALRFPRLAPQRWRG